jgi:hypothetical protein
VRNAFVHQPSQLTVRAARVFGLGARFAQYRPHALTGMVAQQHRQQLVAVQAIGLGSPGPPVDLDARGVDHDAVDAEGAVQLERPLQEMYGGLYFPVPASLERFVVPRGHVEIRLELYCDWFDIRTAKHWAPKKLVASQ